MSDKKKEETAKEVVVPELTKAQKIWEEIKNKPIELFGLPGQTVSKYCTPVFIEPNKLYVQYKIGALLPMLEELLRNKYDVELVDKYITIAPKVSYAVR